MRQSRLLVLLVPVVLCAPGIGHAGTRTLTGTRGYGGSGECGGAPQEWGRPVAANVTCTTAPKAFKASPRLTGKVTLLSPQDGKAPGTGFGYVASHLFQLGEVPRTSKAVVTIYLHVNSATTSFTNHYLDAVTQSSAASAVAANAVYYEFSKGRTNAVGVGASTSRMLASSIDGSRTSKKDYKLTLTLKKKSGSLTGGITLVSVSAIAVGLMGRGLHDVEIQGQSLKQMVPQFPTGTFAIGETGSMTASYDVTVTKITLTT